MPRLVQLRGGVLYCDTDGAVRPAQPADGAVRPAHADGAVRPMQPAPVAQCDAGAPRRVLVVGCGVAGCAAAAALRDCLGARLELRMVDAAAEAGGSLRSARGANVGAIAVSFDGADAAAAGALLRVAALCDLRHVDDGLRSYGALSRTDERPQGWNASTGQWEHFEALPTNRALVDRLLARAAPESLEFGRRVDRVDRAPNGWTVDAMFFDGLVLAVPPGEATRLVGHLLEATRFSALAREAAAAVVSRRARVIQLRPDLAAKLGACFGGPGAARSSGGKCSRITNTGEREVELERGILISRRNADDVVFVVHAASRACDDVDAGLARRLGVGRDALRAAMTQGEAVDLEQRRQPGAFVDDHAGADGAAAFFDDPPLALCSDWVARGGTVDRALVSAFDGAARLAAALLRTP
ncbi:hypothetical protein M885DRAFT_508562 [Pelagophyceae sp. CCMP2097]|nr:hypothetical protein M885DRAFT_508562 [Pelagophyceae sp. CCMP2097]